MKKNAGGGYKMVTCTKCGCSVTHRQSLAVVGSGPKRGRAMEASPRKCRDPEDCAVRLKMRKEAERKEREEKKKEVSE